MTSRMADGAARAQIAGRPEIRMRLMPILAVLLAFASGAWAHSATGATQVSLVPLRAPAVADEAMPSALVNAARSATAAGRADEAMEAIERAESRVLVRSVRPSRAGMPGDRAGALAMLADVLASQALDAELE